MKKLLPLLGTGIACSRSLHQSHRVLGGLMMTMLAANAEVNLTFDTDLNGVVADTDATSVVWDSVGQRLEINTTGGWKPRCAKIDWNSSDPSMVALKAEMLLAIANGGTLSYDIIVEPTGVTGGNPNYFESMYIGNSPGLWDQTFGGGTDQIVNPSFPLAATINHTVNYTIVNATSAASDTVAQFNPSSYLEIWLGLNSAGGTTVKYYIDNIKIAANLVVAPLVAPELSITPAVRGLNMFASSAGQYDRNGIRTQGDNLSFVAPGSTYPKSYEVTLSQVDYGADRIIQMYLACPSASQLTAGFDTNAADYVAEDCIVFGMHQNSDTALSPSAAILRYKVNNSDSNNSLPGGTGRSIFDPDATGDGTGGYLGNYFDSTQRTGTWKLTFSDATTYTITNPEGVVSSPNTLPASVSSRFTGYMYVYVTVLSNGIIPQRYTNTILSRFVIKEGANALIDQDFTTGTYTAGTAPGQFQKSAAAPSGIVQVTPDTGAFWLSWTAVDPTFSGFSLIQSTDLGMSNPWSMANPIPVAGAFSSKIGTTMLLPSSAVADPTKCFFRLQKERP